MIQDRLPLLLFAKAPIAGKVKTRLQSHCSAEQASQIAEVLLEESIIQATKYWPGKVFLSVALDSEHPFLKRMCAQYSVDLVVQCAGDLGDKMSGAFESFGYPAAIMGCDAPHITGQDLLRAYHLLGENKPVLGPSDDGGYYFIGLSDSCPDLFNNIDWGTSSVLSTTLALASRRSLSFSMLEPLNDVDEWDDLLAVAKKIPNLNAVIPHSN